MAKKKVVKKKKLNKAGRKRKMASKKVKRKAKVVQQIKNISTAPETVDEQMDFPEETMESNDGFDESGFASGAV